MKWSALLIALTTCFAELREVLSSNSNVVRRVNVGANGRVGRTRSNAQVREQELGDLWRALRQVQGNDLDTLSCPPETGKVPVTPHGFFVVASKVKSGRECSLMCALDPMATGDETCASFVYNRTTGDCKLLSARPDSTWKEDSCCSSGLPCNLANVRFEIEKVLEADIRRVVQSQRKLAEELVDIEKRVALNESPTVRATAEQIRAARQETLELENTLGKTASRLHREPPQHKDDKSRSQSDRQIFHKTETAKKHAYVPERVPQQHAPAVRDKHFKSHSAGPDHLGKDADQKHAVRKTTPKHNANAHSATSDLKAHKMKSHTTKAHAHKAKGRAPLPTAAKQHATHDKKPQQHKKKTMADLGKKTHKSSIHAAARKHAKRVHHVAQQKHRGAAHEHAAPAAAAGEHRHAAARKLTKGAHDDKQRAHRGAADAHHDKQQTHPGHSAHHGRQAAAREHYAAAKGHAAHHGKQAAAREHAAAAGHAHHDKQSTHQAAAHEHAAAKTHANKDKIVWSGPQTPMGPIINGGGLEPPPQQRSSTSDVKASSAGHKSEPKHVAAKVQAPPKEHHHSNAEKAVTKPVAHAAALSPAPPLPQLKTEEEEIEQEKMHTTRFLLFMGVIFPAIAFFIGFYSDQASWAGTLLEPLKKKLESVQGRVAAFIGVGDSTDTETSWTSKWRSQWYSVREVQTQHAGDQQTD